MARSQFVTKTGVVAATVGSAVGLGNIWRFPYEAGMHGGGAFLIIYIVCVFLIGMPVMLSEFSIGRATHSNGVGAFRKLAPHSPFRFAAYMGIASSIMIFSFYSVVAGWIMEYLLQSAIDVFARPTPETYANRFEVLISNPWRPAAWTLIYMAINLMVLRRGIEKGIEKMSNLLMPCLFLLLIVLCANSLSLPKATEGIEFLLSPNFDMITPSIVIGAMGQAFFTLSLGLTCMLTYASYFSDSTNLMKSATLTAVLDTFVAIVAGLIIFPAVFTYGMRPEAGPKLVFEILPEIFAQMPGGSIWSAAFFLLLFFASLTSTISMSEISIAFFIEEHKMSRPKATWLSIGVCAALGVLCALSFGPLSHATIFGLNIFELFDYASSNIFLPIGGIMLSLFAGWVLDKKILREQLTNGGKANARWVKPARICMRWIAPAAISVVFLFGIL